MYIQSIFNINQTSVKYKIESFVMYDLNTCHLVATLEVKILFVLIK